MRHLLLASILTVLLLGSPAAYANPADQAKVFEAYSTRIKVPLNEVTPVKTASLGERFPKFAGVDEDDFVGKIPLQDIETFPVTETLKRQVERVMEVEVSTNDIEDLPAEMLFDTSSGEQMLKRAAVSFEVVARDDTQTQRGEDGMPVTYKATMIFRGVEEYDEVTYYEAVAHYKGQVTSAPSGVETVRGTCALEDESTQTVAAVGAAKPVTPAPAEDAPYETPAESSFPVPAVAAATGVALIVVCFGATRNARVAAQGLTDLRTIGYAHIKKTAQGYECTIPSWINLPKRVYQEERAVIVPRKRLGDRPGILTVMWRDTVLFRGDLSRRVSLAVPSTSTLSVARREVRARVTALATGVTVLGVLAVVTVSVLNTMLKI